MCGVCGLTSPSPEAELGRVALKLTQGLVHRGPDGSGFWLGGRTGGTLAADDEGLCAPAEIVLGHRRLSIVDLEGGAQPMANEDRSVWVSFNGEIYNQGELRRKLEGRGHRFRTRADTEVLVHGWEEWGERLFGRLNGIFALSLLDLSRREIVLARDPVGVKPLYVGADRGRLWWTSELAAAGSGGVLPGSLSPDGLKLFLTFRFIPSPWTLFEHAWKVPPGHYLRHGVGEPFSAPRFIRYGSEIRSAADPRTEAEWGEAMMVELEGAVDRQLMADVPVAALLSGGVDSSLVTQLMAERLPYAPVTFGIGFDSDGDTSEAAVAQKAADTLGVPHHSRTVADSEYVDAWPALLGELGEPIANQSAPLVRLICQDVHGSHKVVLTGQGADEPLGGYPRHLVERLYLYGRLVPWLSRVGTSRLFGQDNGNRLARALRASDRTDRFLQILSVTPPDAVDSLVPDGTAPAIDLARSAIGRALGPESAEDSVNQLLHLDTQLSLADDLLIVADHCAMRSSVELRVPFLDLQFLELVERMPSAYKISAFGKRKWLYREAATRRLPAQQASELGAPERLQKKRGFSAPLEDWFGSPNGVLQGDQLAPLDDLPFLSGGEARQMVRSKSWGARQRALLYVLATWAARHPQLIGAGGM